MKRIYLFVVLIALGAAVLGSNPAYAQEKNDTQNGDTATQAASVKYDLSYPGILPDNPLYKLKVLRDKIAAAIISDPLKKVDFYLLQADKGVLASAILVDKKEVGLAKQTALKAENNMTLLTYQFGQLSTRPEDSFFDRLEKASLKHQEVFLSLSKRVSANDAKTFINALDFSKRNLQTIEDFKKPHESQ